MLRKLLITEIIITEKRVNSCQIISLEKQENHHKFERYRGCHLTVDAFKVG